MDKRVIVTNFMMEGLNHIAALRSWLNLVETKASETIRKNDGSAMPIEMCTNIMTNVMHIFDSFSRAEGAARLCNETNAATENIYKRTQSTWHQTCRQARAALLNELFEAIPENHKEQLTCAELAKFDCLTSLAGETQLLLISALTKNDTFSVEQAVLFYKKSRAR